MMAYFCIAALGTGNGLGSERFTPWGTCLQFCMKNHRRDSLVSLKFYQTNTIILGSNLPICCSWDKDLPQLWKRLLRLPH